MTSVFLILFAAGMLSHSFHELQELGWFGSETHFLQTIVWDTSSFLNDKTSELGKFIRTLFGYQDQPTWLEIISYFGYYLSLVGLFFLVKILKKNQTKHKVKTTDIQENEVVQ